MARTVIAGDFGGTNLRAAIVEEGGELLERHEIQTPAESSPEQILERLSELLAGIMPPGGDRPIAACLAVPGLINADEGMVLVAPNISGFRNLVLTTPIARRLGIPAFIENDASAAALGEFRFGAGQGTRHLLHATLGTGIGGGIVVDRKLYRGAKGLAGEIGHIVLDPSGPKCNCGGRGCMEALVSGVAFAGRAEKLIASGKAPILAALVGEREPKASDLFAAAQRESGRGGRDPSWGTSARAWSWEPRERAQP
jgi:glucokinase